MPRATHGGRRPGAGRPPAYREPLVRATVMLPVSYAEQLRRFGGDNLSEGIRRLVEEARTPAGHFWYVLPDWARPPATVTVVDRRPPSPASRQADATKTEAAME